jgi:hypothetical protein
MTQNIETGRCHNCKYFLGIWSSSSDGDGVCSDYIKLCRIAEYVDGRAIIQFANKRQPQRNGWKYDNPPCADWERGR